MARYPALVQAIQQQRSLKIAYLVRFDFKSGAMRVWDGFGQLSTLNPFASNPATAGKIVWDGLGTLGTISDIDRNLVSSTVPTLSLSGVDPAMAQKSLNAGAEIRGLPCRVFEQYFDPDTSQPVDMPLALYTGLMDSAPIRFDGPTSCTISLTLMTVLYRRRRSQLAYLSDRTQRTLYPDDAGCTEIPALVQRDRSWPYA